MPAKTITANQQTRLFFRWVSSFTWLHVLSNQFQCSHKKGEELGVTTPETLTLNTWALEPPDSAFLPKNQPINSKGLSLDFLFPACSPAPGSLSIWCTTLLGRTACPWLPSACALLSSSEGWPRLWNSHSLLFLTAVCKGGGREVSVFWGWRVQLDSAFENFWKVKLNLIRKALVTCTDTSNANNEHRWGALFQSQLGTWDQKKKKKIPGKLGHL